MSIDVILRSALMTLEDVHVTGRDAKKLAGAMDSVRAVINALNRAKEETANENQA